MRFVNKIAGCFVWHALRFAHSACSHQAYVRAVVEPLQCEYKQIAGNKINSKEPYLIVSNHRSVLDPLIVMRLMHVHDVFTISGVAKKKLIYGWFLQKMVREAGQKLFFPSEPKLSAKAAKLLAGGDSFLLMPEGERNRTTKPLLPFKSGAQRIIKKAKVSVVMCYVDGAADALSKGKSGVLVKYAVISADEAAKETLETIYRRVFEIDEA